MLRLAVQKGDELKKGNLSLIFTLTMLMMGVASINLTFSGEGKSNNIYWDNGQIVIQATGNQNVPKFTLHRSDDDSIVYSVHFKQMFEITENADDANSVYDEGVDSKVPRSTVALAKMSWEIGNIVTEDSGNINFNINGHNDIGYDVIFQVHFNPDLNEFKFDIVVFNYSFISDDSSSLLVLAFDLSVTGGNEGLTQDGNSIELGDGAYFESLDEAIVEFGTIGVGLSANLTSGRVFLAYEHFDGTFLHDPIVGMNAPIEEPIEEIPAETGDNEEPDLNIGENEENNGIIEEKDEISRVGERKTSSRFSFQIYIARI